jgi:hypothetical protein
MTSKTTNKFSPEVRARAVRMVLDHEHAHASRGRFTDQKVQLRLTGSSTTELAYESRCERVTRRPSPRNHSANSSATATERCLPPVQPMAMVK